MGIENERTALSIESIPKSISEVQMGELPTEAAGNSGEIVESPLRQNHQKTVEKNGE
jgi:hypothetical protein